MSQRQRQVFADHCFTTDLPQRLGLSDRTRSPSPSPRIICITLSRVSNDTDSLGEIERVLRPVDRRCEALWGSHLDRCLRLEPSGTPVQLS